MGTATIHRYVGVDMGTDGGRTGCAWLDEHVAEVDGAIRPRSLAIHFSSGGYRRSKGLDELVDRVVRARRCAITTPLGIPAPLSVLLAGHEVVDGIHADAFRYRVTELAMRQRLRDAELPPTWVSTALRVDASWRGLSLVSRSGTDVEAARRGEGLVIECHARLAAAELLLLHHRWDGRAGSVLTATRKTGKSGGEAGRNARRYVLKLIAQAFRKAAPGFLRAEEWRTVDDDPVAFDALLAAFTAYARELDTAHRYPRLPHPLPREASLEGVAWAPNWSMTLERVAQRRG